MKKGSIVVILIMLFAMSAIAQETKVDSPRVSELKQEAQGLMQQRQQLQQEYQQEISVLDVRLIEIQGAIKELER